MRTRPGRLKYLGLFLFLFAIYLARASQPPNLPLVVFGKVSYESGEPAEGIAVTAKWIDKKSQSQHLVTSTLTKKEAIAIGNPNLAGQYKFFEEDIYLGSTNMVSMESAGKIVTINVMPGIMTQAPDIILPIGSLGDSEYKKESFFENVVDKVAVLIGYEEVNEDLDSAYNPYAKNDINSSGIINSPQQKEDLNNFTSGNNDLYNVSKEKIKRTDLIYLDEKYSPVIERLNNTFYFCEGQEVMIKFNITNADYDPLDIGIYPNENFNVSLSKSFEEKDIEARLYSGKLTKKDAGSHNLLVFAYDNTYVDTKNLTIKVTEINNPPKFKEIGVITLPTSQLKTFSYQAKVMDVEEGDQNSGNFNFSLNFIKGKPFFDIGKNGAISFELSDDLKGFYYISICVKDNGLQNIPKDISLCNQDGGPIEVCANMSLTITDYNREPSIVSKYPPEENLNFDGGSLIFFNISKQDLDGTIPDTYWYVDGDVKKRDSNSIIDRFSYSFDCYVTGPHKIRAEITDGIINKSAEWDLTINSCKSVQEELGTFKKIEKKYPGFMKKFFWIFMFWIFLIFLSVIVYEVLMWIRIKKELEMGYGKNK